MILLDTSGLLAALDGDSRRHEEARAVVAAEQDALILSPFVLAELDYLVTARLGTGPALALLEDVAARRYSLAPFNAEDVAEAKSVIEQYRDLGLGLTDASLVVLAGSLGTNRLLSLDERHFRAVTSPSGAPFELLPADA